MTTEPRTDVPDASADDPLAAWPRRVSVDFEAGTVSAETANGVRVHPMASAEAFELVSTAYLRCGWDAKHVYGFSWLGRPIIQLPEDMVRVQELIYAVKPDVVLETGIAHGGSLVLSAGVCRAMGRGRVIGVDIEIRPHNRAAIEAHELFDLITLIEGSSVDPDVVARVRGEVREGERVLALLDSNHTRDHVLAELEAYAPLIPVGSYIVAMDGIMRHLVGAPRSRPDWDRDNPVVAAAEFAARHPEFVVEDPPIPFNEGLVRRRATYCPGGFLRRVR